MIKELINFFENKKILILGFGLEGQSTYKLIRKYLKNQQIYIADKVEKFYENSEILKEEKNAVYIDGENYMENLEKFDVIMKAPGISFKGMNIEKFKDKIKSELELLLEFFDVYTIGITGTKGKSTTSSLIYEILKQQNKDVMLLGNIGTPVFDFIDEIKEKMTLVLEISSHQLEYMDLSPNIAILLNIYEEHLDHYNSFQKYIDAKCNIFSHQNKNDVFLYSIDSENVRKNIEKYQINAKTYEISIQSTENKQNRTFLKENEVIFNSKVLYNANDKRKLLGRYNLSNIMFALTVSEILGLNLSKTIDTINNFEPLPHRIEKVGEYGDIIYYNDAIATIPEATINSIEALEKVNTLIIGGMDRGVNFDSFIKYLSNSNIENLICMPKTGHIIGEKVHNDSMTIFMVDTMEEAVNTAKAVTKKKQICLLSPAAASYGYFKNFKEKGELYKKLVKDAV